MTDKMLLNRFIKICLDIAEYYDTKGEENEHFLNDDMTRKLGLGYRALSGYMREGVKEIINLQGNYHTVKEQLHYAQEWDKEADNESSN